MSPCSDWRDETLGPKNFSAAENISSEVLAEAFEIILLKHKYKWLNKWMEQREDAKSSGPNWQSTPFVLSRAMITSGYTTAVLCWASLHLTPEDTKKKSWINKTIWGHSSSSSSREHNAEVKNPPAWALHSKHSSIWSGFRCSAWPTSVHKLDHCLCHCTQFISHQHQRVWWPFDLLNMNFFYLQLDCEISLCKHTVYDHLTSCDLTHSQRSNRIK